MTNGKGERKMRLRDLCTFVKPVENDIGLEYTISNS